MNKYIEILNNFVSEDGLRPSINTPAILEKYAAATDAYSLVFFPKTLLPENTVFDRKESFVDIKRFINLDENCNIILNLNKIEEVVSKCPLIEKKVEECKDCKECDGTGEVEYEYTTSDWNTNYITGECPACEGMGKICIEVKGADKELIKDGTYNVQIGNIKILVKHLERILQVQKLLNEDITVINTSNNTVLFKIGEVKILQIGVIGFIGNAEYNLGNIE